VPDQLGPLSSHISLAATPVSAVSNREGVALQHDRGNGPRAHGVWRALLAGTVFGFFLTSRYSFALFSLATSLVLMARFGRAETGWSKWRLLFSFAVPLCGAGIFIIAVALRPQYAARISYHGGELIQYFAATTAADKSASQIGAMLATNLLIPFALPLTVAALLGVLILLPRRVAAQAGLHRFAASLETGCSRLVPGHTYRVYNIRTLAPARWRLVEAPCRY